MKAETVVHKYCKHLSFVLFYSMVIHVQLASHLLSIFTGNDDIIFLMYDLGEQTLEWLNDFFG